MSMDSRFEKIEEDIKELDKDVATVKTHVTNHLPHMIADVRSDIDALSKKLIPLETKSLKSQGVNDFLNLSLKVAGLIGAAVWTILQIFDKLNWYGM